MITVEPGFRCSRCLSVSPTVRVEATCIALFLHSKPGVGETPYVYLCLDCLREAVAILEEFNK